MARNRKLIYGLTIGLGALALIIDRLGFTRAITGPETVQASSSGTGNPATTPGNEGTNRDLPVLANLVVIATPFPDHLPPLGDAQELRDVFRPIVPQPAVPSVGAADVPGETTVGPGQEPSADRPSARQFLANHRLSGVISNSRFEYAIVDGVCIELGEAVDGCVLARVAGEEAFFGCFDGEAVLSVGGDAD